MENEKEVVQTAQQEGVKTIKKGPKCLEEFNWGAFCFPWIWGFVYDCTLWAILAFIPYVNIVISFIAGFKGNKEAWEKYSKQEGTTPEQFDTAQAKWNKVGKIVFIISIVLSIVVWSLVTASL